MPLEKLTIEIQRNGETVVDTYCRRDNDGLELHPAGDTGDCLPYVFVSMDGEDLKVFSKSAPTDVIILFMGMFDFALKRLDDDHMTTLLKLLDRKLTQYIEEI